MKTVNVRNAFQTETGTYQAYAEKDGTARVYDSIAGYFTTCHSLTESQIKYVRARATN